MSEPGHIAEKPWTIGRLLQWTTDFFSSRGVDEPRLSAEILLAHALGCDRIFLYTRFDEVPVETVLTQFREHVRRAGKHEPVAYLVGHKEFYSLEFEVNADVLIPRPETETLVEFAAAHCRKAGLARPKILDIGTGSGCVIVTLLKQMAEAMGVATDCSAAALEVAKRNAERHGVTGRLTLVKADKLSLAPDSIPPDRFDVIVSNPPYVAEQDMDSLPANVREYEPPGALTPGGDGLAFYRTISAEAGALLGGGGAVLVEMGAGQREAVTAVFAGQGGWRHVGTHKSGTDPHDRVLQFAKKV